MLLLSPVALAAAWLFPRAVVTGRSAGAARWVAGFCALCALVSLALAVTGVTGQSNAAVAAAFAPTMIYLGMLVPALTLIGGRRA